MSFLIYWTVKSQIFHKLHVFGVPVKGNSYLDRIQIFRR